MTRTRQPGRDRRVRRLVYLTNHRIPTEKANGLQIAKMCQAFAAQGVQVVLAHPVRHQPDPALREISLFEFYGIEKTFAVEPISNVDLLRVTARMPGKLGTWLNFAHSIIWSGYAVRAAGVHDGDVYYTREPVIAFWLLRAGFPTVLELHTFPRRFRRLLLNRIARDPRLTLIVTLTSHLRDRLVAEGFPADRVAVHPDAVALEDFADLPSKDECRLRLGLPVDRPIVGYVGRFRAMAMEKGVPELVRALASWPSPEGQPPVLVCVGGPMDAVKEYRRLGREEGLPDEDLRFYDRVPNSEVPVWMRAADVVTIPWTWNEFSAYFTSPLKLFEYMAAGVPILASDLPSIREILTHGRNGWLVPAGDPKALAEGMRYLMENLSLSASLARQARQDVEQYTWSGRAGEILEAINR